MIVRIFKELLRFRPLLPGDLPLDAEYEVLE